MSTTDTLNEAADILDRAYATHKPVAVVGMYSSGDDSGATMIALEAWAARRGVPFQVAHINTGIGIEASRVHARSVAAARGWRFSEWRTDPAIYERLVTGQWPGIPGGFPSKPMHKAYYGKLKDRRVWDILRHFKQGAARSAGVMLVSGIRQRESRIRMGYRDPINKYRAQIWVNPLFHRTKDDCLDLMELGNLPRNPASQTIHMSGECLCGAMNGPGELAEIRYWFPETARELDRIAAQVQAAGYPWGWDEERPAWYDAMGAGQQPLFDFMPLCVGCEARHAPGGAP